MKSAVFYFIAAAILGASCSKPVEPLANAKFVTASPQLQSRTVVPTPSIPNLQTELFDDRNKTTTSPIGNFDFKNYTYELPRGWQNPDGTADFTLTNGRVAPVEGKVIKEDMTDEEKAEVKLGRRIGMSYVTTKFIDVTGDGQDEAIVILKVETAGAAIPQIVYIFDWKDGKPELLWPFRTGDRADGGLKDIRFENGLLVIELYGQDRFLLGQTETGKITGDEEQLCCPTHWTRSFYKWNGKSFTMQGKRLTYSVAAPSEPPTENLGDKVNVRLERQSIRRSHK
ncbi:MAG: hypothetical protein IPL32_09930 [Chloracidobacterium sp.]|nr:hypothetical protein [Chloracidobacterium sp.]